MKKGLIFIIALVVVFVGYLIIFKTPFVYNRTTTYSKWATRYMRIQAGENSDQPGFIFYDDKNSIMDDYVQNINSSVQDLVRYSTKTAGATQSTDLMAWREGRTLYIVNPSCYTDIPQQDVVSAWTLGLQKIHDHVQMPITDKAFYDFSLMYFNKLVIKNSAPDSKTAMPDVTLTLTYGDDRDKFVNKQ